VKISRSDKWPTSVGPLTWFASKLWTYDDGRSDYALSVWLGGFSLYCQVGKKWKFNCGWK
jgi:hypothetical protein